MERPWSALDGNGIETEMNVGIENENVLLLLTLHPKLLGCCLSFSLHEHHLKKKKGLMFMYLKNKTLDSLMKPNTLIDPQFS